MAVLLERFVGSAAQAHHRAFERAQGRVEVNGLHVGQVGAGTNRQLIQRVVRVVLAGNDGEFALIAFVEPLLSLGHAGQLSQREAVHGRNGKVTHTAFQGHVQHRAVYVVAVGVGTVQEHHMLALGAAGVHEVAHGNIIGVEPQAYILDVHDENVEHVHGLVGGTHAAGTAVQRQDGNAGERLYAVSHVGTVIGQVPEAVLRREDGGDVHALCDEGVQHVLLTTAHEAGLVGEDGYPLALQEGKVFAELFVSQYHAALFTGATGKGSEAAEGQKENESESFHITYANWL